jgi:trimethylamine--corrinoid protein Co-methyltransferase
MTPMDVPSQICDLAVVKLYIERSRKHFWALASSTLGLQYALEMLEVAAGSRENLRKRPLASGIVYVVGPLRMPYDEIERLLLYGRYGIPVRVPLTAVVGANAPVTLAGTLTQVNAEFLGASTVIQILCPGLPLWYYPLISIFDAQTGATIADGPDVLLVYSACAQMARRYRTPSNLTNLSLGSVQSHQIMYHLGVYQFFGAFLGASEQGGAGSVQDAMGYSHEALVLSDESMAYTKRFRSGMNVTAETLAVDDIREMSQVGEYFSSPLSSRRIVGEERHSPRIWAWDKMVDWPKSSGTIVDRASRVVKNILGTHSVPPIPEDKRRELDRIYSLAEPRLLGQQGGVSWSG